MNGTGIRKFLKLGSVTMSILLVLFGLAFVIAPDVSARVIVYVIAAVLILLGVYNIVTYFFEERYTVMMRNSFTVGVVCAMGGTALLFIPDVLIGILPLMWGCVLVAGGIAKAQGAMDLNRMAYKRWYVALISSILSLVLGIVVLADPFGAGLVLTRFIGVALILEGVGDAISTVTLDRVTRLFYPDKH